MDFIFIVAILIMSVVVHEVSHGYAALAMGDPTAKYQGRLTLNPISHLDPVGSFLVPVLSYFLGGFFLGWARPVPFNPYNLKPEKVGIPTRFGEAAVAIAGPLSNLAIATVFGLLIRFGYPGSLFNEAFLTLTIFVVTINITLGIFNMIPVPPLDGSKVLFALLPYKWHSIRESLERYGFIIILLFLSVFWQLIHPIINSIFSLITGLS